MNFLLSKLDKDNDYMHVLYELLIEDGIIDSAESKTVEGHELESLRLLRQVIEQWADENIESEESENS